MSIGLVAIGASWGGVTALRRVLGDLPAGFPAPVVVVLHRSPHGSEGLAYVLRASCELPVAEARDKAPLVGGHVYLAPAGYHLMVERGTVALNTDEPHNFARPSVDVLFESVADAYGRRAIGVILTGSGSDGARGLGRMKDEGAITLVQDPTTAENRGMPDAALLAVKVDRVEPLEKIARTLVELCR